jgi:hypothetical protein
MSSFREDFFLVRKALARHSLIIPSEALLIISN